MNGTRHDLPPIDSKGGLTAARTLQSGLDVLQHMAHESRK